MKCAHIYARGGGYIRLNAPISPPADTYSNIDERPNNTNPKSQFRSGKGLGFNDHQDDSGSHGAIATIDTGSRTSVVSTEEPQVKTYSETSFVEVEEQRNLTVYAPNMAQQILGNLGLISGMVILVEFFLEHCAFCK
ncbi:GM11054 [Drosophila sechellia]|uniref:GM11054 n=1 Tax=Drosophila sechellia TaxID=7238 RepID=B4HX59_DROSE|nr:GM11054 [Drosophila sechellia]